MGTFCHAPRVGFRFFFSPLNSFFIFIFAPFLAWAWSAGQAPLESSAPQSFAIGVMLMG